MAEKIEKTYTISGTPEQLQVLERFFIHIQKLGEIGASRNLLLQVDGDGSARLGFKDKDGLYLSDYIKQLNPEEIGIQQTIKGNSVGAIAGIYSLE